MGPVLEIFASLGVGASLDLCPCCSTQQMVDAVNRLGYRAGFAPKGS